MLVIVPIQSAAASDSAGILNESVYGLVNVIGLYNDRLIASQTDSSSLGEGAALASARWALTCLASLDVVLELLAGLKGHGARWKMVRRTCQCTLLCDYNVLLLFQISAIESARAALKLFVLVESKAAHLLNGGQLQRPVLPSPPSDGQTEVVAPIVPRVSESAARARWWKGSRSGLSMPVPVSVAASTVLSQDLAALAQPTRMLGEVLHISRPIVFLLAR